MVALIGRCGHSPGGCDGASQTVLPFKLAASDESLTAQSGLALYGEYLRAMDVGCLIDHELPGPGSAAYHSFTQVKPVGAARMFIC